MTNRDEIKRLLYKKAYELLINGQYDTAFKVSDYIEKGLVSLRQIQFEANKRKPQFL